MSNYADLVELVLREAGQDLETFPFDEDYLPSDVPRSIHPRTLVAITPGHIAPAQLQFHRMFAKGIQRSAVFMWDVDVVPRRLQMGFRLVDELWTASTMGAEYLREYTKKSVEYFPAPVLEPPPGPSGIFRKSLGLHEEFVIAYQFDMGSGIRRKNAGAAIEIYRSAFPKVSGETHLVLKCTPTDKSSPEWRLLESAAAGRADISLVSDFWSDELVGSMYKDIDCYLSPHRSEGYGLTVAEAMASGTYVIATGYGGPMDFMDSRYCGLIPYRLVEVGPDAIYPERARWAEPDVDSATDLLRDAYLHRDVARSKALRARTAVLETFSLQRSVEWLNSRR